LLEVRDLVAFYDDSQALWGVGIDVREGEIVALLGSNGAGKTTLLRVLSGLVRARAGRVRLRGQDITNWPPHAIVDAGVAHVPEGRQLFPEMTVEENLLVGAHVARARRRRGSNLEKLYATFPRLRERRGQLAATLSGGEQQMLALARALMSEPKLLLLDEPSLGLSPLATSHALSLIKGIAARDLTVVLVEQKVTEALEIAERGYVIENGRLVTEGSSRDLARDPRVRQAYLGF
jgi:branched-chain amino acid transport system ATP-binding protein